jgi:nucleotide-binding universal stress UspA family protein
VLNTGSGQAFSQEMVFESGMLQEMLEAVRPFYHFIAHAKLEEGINEFVAANQLDILVVLPKRHGFFERMFHVSQTKQLALHCHIPILALHERV